MRAVLRASSDSAATASSATWAMAPCRPPIATYAPRVSSRPSRRSHNRVRHDDTSGSNPGSEPASVTTASASPSVSRPGAPGRLLDDPTYLRGAQRADQQGVVRQRSGEPGLVREAGEVVTADGQDHAHRGAFVGGQLAEYGQERRALGLVGARRPDLLELVDDQHRLRAVGGLALGAEDQAAQQVADVDGSLPEGLSGQLPQGCSPGRMTSRVHEALPGMTSSASAASNPARTSDDLPLPDGPTSATTREPATRATSSATARSRPQYQGASVVS